MRKISILIMVIMITTCYALKISAMKNLFEEADLALHSEMDNRLPVSSQAKTGSVQRHPVDFKGVSFSIFIIGDDDISRLWLVQHRDELRKIGAVGLVTNISEIESLHELETLVGTSLMPIDVDDLLAVIKTENYPLIFHEGMVWQ